MHKFEESSIKQFDWWAKNYRLFTFWFDPLNKKIAQEINPKKEASILDVGCGWGLLLKQLSLLDRNLKLFGIDISPEMVKVAKNNFLENLEIEIKEGSADKLPYKDNTFDYVTCILSFHHHPNSLRSLQEMNRVLKPGGQLILLDAFKENIIQKIFLKYNEFIFNEKDTQHYSKAGMKELFEKAGFKNIMQKTPRFYHLLSIGNKK